MGESAPKKSGDKSPHSKACDDVIERARYALKIAEQNRWLLDIALDDLTLGRAALYRAIILQSEISNQKSQIADHVAAAVAGLRAAGDVSRLPHGLLTRAWPRCLVGDACGSRADLDEAWEIADRGPMPLFQADVLLSRVRLFGRVKGEGGRGKGEKAYPWGSAQQDLAEARRLIETHGYHRRDEELAAAEQALRAAPGGWSRER